MPRVRSAIAAIAVWAGLTVLPASSVATTGGPTQVEVLGHDPRDGKIYYAVTPGGEVDDGREVFFMRLAGPRAGVAVRVRSIHRGIPELDPDGVLDERIARLRRRLRPLRPAVASPRGDDEHYGTTLARPVRGVTLARRVVKRWRDEWGATWCRNAVLVLSSASGAAGTVRVTECGTPARVTIAYDLPEGRRLVIVSTKPDTHEGGYEFQIPVLLVPK